MTAMTLDPGRVRSTPRHGGRWVRRTALAAVGLLLLVSAVLTVHYRSTDWWWGPDRVHLLGRDYDRQPGFLSRAQAEAGEIGPLHTIGHLPLGQAFLAVRSAEVPTVVFLDEWGGHYVAYALDGGP